MASEVQTALLPEVKFSRYRSVKKALARDALPSSSLSMKATPSQKLSAVQSFSRYRHERPAKAHEKKSVASSRSISPKGMSSTCQISPAPSHTVSSPSHPVQDLSQLPDVDAFQPTTRSRTIPELKTRERLTHTRVPGTPSEATAASPQVTSEWQAQQQRRMDKASQEAQPAIETEAEAEAKSEKETIGRKGIGGNGPERKESQKAAERSYEHHNQPKTLEVQRREGSMESKTGTSAVRPPTSSRKSFKGDRDGPLPNSDRHTSIPALPTRSEKEEGTGRTVLPLKGIEEPGAGAVLGVDAPLSAVNAGERRVLVKCNNSAIKLPITTTTTSLELVVSAANVLPESIQPSTSILLESFTQLGLERPIRKYENVRDIMNSWDHDAQNSLNLVPSSTAGIDDNLEVNYVTEARPPDISVYVYYSQKPGKWDKRWVMLRSDGQVQIAKKDGAETSNICHMSDFDIYVPTRRQMAKRIRPPKKICFAIKSQQKSSIFLSAASFVHFFATNDKKIAGAWYRAVQGWRSWYLVNIMGKGKRVDKTDTNSMPPSHGVSVSGPTSEIPRHVKPSSTASMPYQIDSFKPFQPPYHFQSEGSSEDRPSNFTAAASLAMAKASHARKMSVRERAAPPISSPMKLTKDTVPGESATHTKSRSLARNPPLQEVESTTFAPTGLLGRTYSHRQRAQLEREIALPSSSAGPFLTGLVKGESDSPVRGLVTKSEEPAFKRAMSMSSVTRESTGLKRTLSQHPKPNPLVDLTPEFKEAPQHTRKGRGIFPQRLPPGGLVDIATSLEVPIPIPPATTWRRPGTSNDKGFVLQRTSPTRPSVDTIRSSGKDDTDAFTGGLLATTGVTTQGGTGRSRGVMMGNRNVKGPMIDVSEKSRFVPGSLLAHVEQNTGCGGPTIEREKRREVNMAVGEGL